MKNGIPIGESAEKSCADMLPDIHHGKRDAYIPKFAIVFFLKKLLF
jgi:hypothetical protein